MKHLARRNSDLSSQWTGLVFVLLLCALLVGITACPELVEGAVTLAKPVEPSLNLSLSNAFPALTFSKPVDIANAGDERLFIVEQVGIIKVTSLMPDSSASVFLDIRDRVTEVDEKGLLGLVFHPDYANNGYFYVNYT